MHTQRRASSWLALAAILLYGIAPLLAAVRPAQSAPVACVAEAVHTCSCRVGPHAAAACCCGAPAKGSDCGIAKLPCDAETGPEAVLALGQQFLDLPRRPQVIPPHRRHPSRTWRDPEPTRALAREITPPPPRRLNRS